MIPQWTKKDVEAARLLQRQNSNSTVIEQNSEGFFETVDESVQEALSSSLNVDEFINEVDRLYYRVACYTLSCWIILSLFSYWVAWDKLEKLEGVEHNAPLFAGLLLLMFCITSVIPQVITRKKQFQSGIFFGAMMVHLIALTTDLMMAFLPVPVVTNPITNTRVYLLRWCEWSPLAFLMTFFTESCGVLSPEIECNRNSSGERISNALNILRKQYKENRFKVEKGFKSTRSQCESMERDGDSEARQTAIRKLVYDELRPSYRLAWNQGISTLCGWLFPFISNPWIYALVLIFSFVMYLSIIHRVHIRTIMYQKMEIGISNGDKEMHEWTRLSLQLLKTCAALWTILIIAYSMYTFGPLCFPTVELFKIPWLSIVIESVFDVFYKAIYMFIIVDVHEMIFDPKARSGRRLEELRQMMGVVWENSSDIICISVKGASGDVSTLLSPTYLKLYPESTINSGVSQGNSIGNLGPKVVAFDISASTFKNLDMISDESLRTSETNIIPTNAYDVDFTQNHAMFSSPTVTTTTIKKERLAPMAQLVTRAWKAKEETNARILMHTMVRTDGESPRTIRCEANISIMEENVLVIVVRDISERFKRFEAEKKVIGESTARRKDAAANRFTRHEVKNGLLAAIGLCDSLNDFCLPSSVSNPNKNGVMPLHDPGNHQNSRILQASPEASLTKNAVRMPSDNSRYVSELGKTLNEILDTVLAEAMARDVIHEVYEPKLEKVNLPTLMAITANPSTNDTSSKRYPIHTNVSPLPEFSLDPQLWKYIHRNAVSNACKYGKASGTVTTELHWDKENGFMKMNVINLPGDNHEAIMSLGDKANALIFSPRKRLKVHTRIDGNNHASASHSAGDGAWIMYKCAKTLGGECSIKFERERTILTFECPVSKYDEAETQMITAFELPPNVYGIAIDDSKIQRQLLRKFFNYLGIASDRVFIHGDDKCDISGFDDWALNFIYNHPNDYFLFIVDENLVVQDDEHDKFSKHVTISGSVVISKLRGRLLPDQEKRVLALIRSANDSASDIAIYNSRAHGYLSKGPIKKESCLDTIAPHWIARFPKLQRFSSENLFGSERKRKLEDTKNASWENGIQPKKLVSKHLHGLHRPPGNVDTIMEVSKNMKRPYENGVKFGGVNTFGEEDGREMKRNKTSSIASDDSEVVDDSMKLEDFTHCIDDIDKYIKTQESCNLEEKWNVIWNKLHALKGDLLMIDRPSRSLKNGIKMMGDMKGETPPLDFIAKWHEIRESLE